MANVKKKVEMLPKDSDREAKRKAREAKRKGIKETRN